MNAPQPSPTPDGAAPPLPAALPNRDHLHRLHFVFGRNPIYFLTCCTSRRHPILTSPDAAKILLSAWHASAEIHGWVIGRHVIMPDHVHFFARAHSTAKPLSDFMRDWKKWTARQISAVTNIPPPVWQSEFFDHVLRSSQSYSEKWDYVRSNPVRAGLVSKPESWPHAGEGEDLSF